MERDAQLATDPAHEPEEQAVDHESDETERQDVERAAHDLDERLEYRVHDAEYQRDQYQSSDRAPRRFGVGGYPRDEEVGDPLGHGRGDQPENDAQHGGDLVTVDVSAHDPIGR